MLKAKIDSFIKEGIDEGLYSGLALLCARGEEILYEGCFGLTKKNGKKVDKNTLFDMASCSKIMSPTLIALMAIDEGRLSLYDSTDKFFDFNKIAAELSLPLSEGSVNIQNVNVLELLTHTSGIRSHVILENYNRDRRGVLSSIASLPLGKKGVPEYSCLGFIVLGKILEKIYGEGLDSLAEKKVFKPLDMRRTCYCPLEKGFLKEDIMASELSPFTNEALQGVVHDENARFMGGISANAGVFSCLSDVYKYALSLVLDRPSLVSKGMLELATKNYTPGFDVFRGLGFQLAGTPLNFSGDIAPKSAFGHTGFTGTSILMSRQNKEIIILLSNRVYPTRNNKPLEFFKKRRMLHNMLHSCFFS